MRSIGELLAEMGFDPESSPDVQKAFFKHLVKAAEQTQAQPAGRLPPPKSKAEPEQLSFNFEQTTSPKKVS